MEKSKHRKIDGDCFYLALSSRASADRPPLVALNRLAVNGGGGGDVEAVSSATEALDESGWYWWDGCCWEAGGSTVLRARRGEFRGGGGADEEEAAVADVDMERWGGAWPRPSFTDVISTSTAVDEGPAAEALCERGGGPVVPTR